MFINQCLFIKLAATVKTIKSLSSCVLGNLSFSVGLCRGACTKKVLVKLMAQSSNSVMISLSKVS